MKKLLILSGKGGTGKTTVASGFIKLGNAKAFADCDVDAPNLHLVLEQKTVPEKNNYYGMGKAKINSDKCLSCGLCISNCRFDAIKESNSIFKVDNFSCEGCGVCQAICPSGAISIYEDIAGELNLYKDEKLFSTAELKMGSGTSGKLVTEVKKQLKAAEEYADFAIIDGSPGIGCPVIASISGVDMVLVVAEPSLSGISDMERVIETAKKFNVMTVVCVNKFDTNIHNTNKIEKFCIDKGLTFVGKIPFDKNIVDALNRGNSIMDIECAGAKAVKEIYIKTIDLLQKVSL